MVISTPAHIAVTLRYKTRPVLESNESISRWSRLRRSRREMESHPIESSQLRHTRNTEVKMQQRDPLITIIGAIMVIRWYRRNYIPCT